MSKKQLKPKQRKNSGLIRKQQRAGYLFIIPWMIGFLLFFLQPLLESFMYTFQDVQMGTNGIKTTYVGIKNFKYLLFQDSSFLTNLWSVVVKMLQQVCICTVLSLFLAIILIQDFHGRTIYRAIFFLPIIMTSGVVYSMVASAVGSTGISGAENAYMVSNFSMSNLMIQGGFSKSAVAMINKVVDSIFSMTTNCGVPILLFISGLQKIPKSSYEAAQIEGASSWDIFWKITIPKISSIIFLNIVYIIVDSCTSYGSKTGGNVMMAAIQSMGFGKTMKFGMSAAMSWMYFAVIAFFLALAYLLIGRKANKIEN